MSRTPFRARPVHLVNWDDDNVVRGTQATAVFAHHAVAPVQSHHHPEFFGSGRHEAVHDSVVLISKIRFASCGPDQARLLSALKSRDNVLVFDLLDSFVDLHFRRALTSPLVRGVIDLFDVLLVNNGAMKRAMQAHYPGKRTLVYYHQWDARLAGDAYRGVPTRDVFYIGVLRKLDGRLRDSPRISIRHPRDIFATPTPCRGFHCTYLEPDHWAFDQHTSAKLATAAVLESPLICPRLPPCEELLPEDYPLFVDDVAGFEDKIDEARSLFGTAGHRDLLRLMRRVKHELAAENLIGRLSVELGLR